MAPNPIFEVPLLSVVYGVLFSKEYNYRLHSAPEPHLNVSRNHREHIVIRQRRWAAAVGSGGGQRRRAAVGSGGHEYEVGGRRCGCPWWVGGWVGVGRTSFRSPAAPFTWVVATHAAVPCRAVLCRAADPSRAGLSTNHAAARWADRRPSTA